MKQEKEYECINKECPCKEHSDGTMCYKEDCELFPNKRKDIPIQKQEKQCKTCRCANHVRKYKEMR